MQFDDAKFLLNFFGSNEDERFGYRNLTAEEVTILLGNSNSSPNWGTVFVPDRISGLERIRGCNFDCEIVLCNFIGNAEIGNGMLLPSGLVNSNFSGKVFLGDNCLIRNTTMVCNVALGKGSSILDCGMVMHDDTVSVCGNCQTIKLGPECGGNRDVTVFSGIDYGTVCLAAFDITNSSFSSSLIERCSEVKKEVSTSISVISRKSILSRCDLIKNVVLGPYCYISSSTVIESTVCSREESPIDISGGCLVELSIFEGSNSVSGPCKIRNCILFEQANILHAAVICHCVLGPDRLHSLNCIYFYYVILFFLNMCAVLSVARNARTH